MRAPYWLKLAGWLALALALTLTFGFLIFVAINGVSPWYFRLAYTSVAAVGIYRTLRQLRPKHTP